MGHIDAKAACDNGEINPHPEREDTCMTISRRDLGFGLAAIATVSALPASAQSSALSPEDRAALATAQANLQNLTSAQGDFVETGPNGQRRTGRFYLQRPGKMRFEYTNPAGLLVVSDGYNVKRFDPRLNVFRQVPLGATPLSTFLARNVRLDQGVSIDRVTRMQTGAFAITARDARRPNDGSVILAFAGSPLRLQEWTITDAQGSRTRTQLTTLIAAPGLSSRLFQLTDPTRRPGRN
ncbi:outer membrane lipoprotein carrier protein LolA [soil metagenome]